MKTIEIKNLIAVWTKNKENLNKIKKGLFPLNNTILNNEETKIWNESEKVSDFLQKTNSFSHGDKKIKAFLKLRLNLTKLRYPLDEWFAEYNYFKIKTKKDLSILMNKLDPLIKRDQMKNQKRSSDIWTNDVSTGVFSWGKPMKKDC